MSASARRNGAVGAALGAAILSTLGSFACTTQVPLPGVTKGPDGGAVDAEPAPAKPDAAADKPRDTVDPSTCKEETPYVNFDINRPEMMVAFDRSYSMTKKFGAQTRLTSARQEVLDLVKANQGGIQFGFLEFPSRNACEQSASCCASPVLVPPANNNFFEVDHELRCDTAASGCFDLAVDSPTNDALFRVRRFFDQEPAADSDRFILLVTDGNPSCGTDTLICDKAATEAKRLADTTGVKTIVVALGEDVKTSACLDSIAMAGGMMKPTSPAYAWGGTVAELHQAIGQAVAPVLDETCRLTFRTPPSKPEKVSVFMRSGSFFDDLPRDPNDKEGWNFDPPGSLEMRLYGSPCEKLRTGQILKSDLRVGVTCTRCGSGPCQ
jgi:hypothetical protein